MKLHFWKPKSVHLVMLFSPEESRGGTSLHTRQETGVEVFRLSLLTEPPAFNREDLPLVPLSSPCAF